eukprot:TRINITY_DN3227_c2_g1_i1.p1 TRINITY_DN3227_c2_g1~~TRINITY_DN3227_c2_g1_i1.p1  ORF type:complete len:317 (+),score=71.38 TRINITY_DN3227_c2_g1_i1:1149-2099(+)
MNLYLFILNFIRFIIRIITKKTEIVRICENIKHNRLTSIHFYYFHKYLMTAKKEHISKLNDRIECFCSSYEFDSTTQDEIEEFITKITEDLLLFIHESYFNEMRQLISFEVYYQLNSSQLFGLQKICFDKTNVTHKELVISLANLSFQHLPDFKPFSLENFDELIPNSLWTKIGFQQSNLTTDFRGNGILSLYGMINVTKSDQFLDQAFNENYPFAITVLNLLNELVKATKMEKFAKIYGNYLILNFMNENQTFDFKNSNFHFSKPFYDYFIKETYKFNEKFINLSQNVMEFNIYFTEFKNQLLNEFDSKDFRVFI